MKGNATAIRSGDNLVIYIPKAIERAEKIVSGNLVEFDIINPKPSYIIEKKRGLNFKKKKIKTEESPKQVLTELKGQVPQEELDKLFVLKSEGNSIEDIRYKFEKESEFSWLDIPNQIIKELEK